MSEPRHGELSDLYEILEISPRATQEVIQAAYRVLARSNHPDLNSSEEAAQRIRMINAAYRVLSDPQDRACYDLEYSRAHRFDRFRGPDQGVTVQRSATAGRTLPTRPLVLQQRPIDERFPMLNGAAVVGLLLLATLAILFVLFAISTDAADNTSGFDGPTIEQVRR